MWLARRRWAVALTKRAASKAFRKRFPCFHGLRLPLGAPGFVPPYIRHGWLAAGGYSRAVNARYPPKPDFRKRSARPASKAAPRGMAASSMVIRLEWMPQQLDQSLPSGATPRKNIAPGAFSST